MLGIQNFWGKLVVTGAFDSNNNLINTQRVEQKLLELAVHNTAMYSTDIIYLINGLEDHFMKADVKEIDIYFRNTGIDWFVDNPKSLEVERPKYYRYIAKLIREGNSIILYYNLGNC